MDDLDVDVAEAPMEVSATSTDDARTRRQRLLKRAFNNLGVLPRSETSGAAPEPAVAPAPATPAAAPSMDTLSPEDQAQAKLIAEKHALLAKKDFFALLNVPRTATKDQLKVAYLQLVKTFHPDRLPPSLNHLALQVKDLFSSVREAYDTLQDETKRKAHLASLQAPVAQTAPDANAEKAEDLANQAEVALKKREYLRAADLFSEAFGLTKKADYLAQHAWACYLDPSKKETLTQIKIKLEEALKVDHTCDRASYCLGVIARVENDLDRAEHYFKMAMDSNSKNTEAATEMRLLQMRRKRPPPPGGKKGGMFG